MPCRSQHPLTRAAALVAALCVLLLAMFAASPTLHAGLHENDHAAVAHDHGAPVGDVEHTCAVTLFAQGAMALLVFCLLLLARPTVAGLNLRTTEEIAVAQPRYRLVPSHAPPVA